MTSGVKVSDSCAKVFQQVKSKMNLAQHEKRTYALFRISEDWKELVVDFGLMDEVDLVRGTQQQRSGGVDLPGLKELAKRLPEEDGRYVVYDYPYHSAGRATSKLIFILWCPEHTPVKQKLLYTSSEDALRKVLNITEKFHAATCIDDLEDANIVGILDAGTVC